jgi:hypothetical protein
MTIIRATSRGRGLNATRSSCEKTPVQNKGVSANLSISGTASHATYTIFFGQSGQGPSPELEGLDRAVRVLCSNNCKLNFQNWDISAPNGATLPGVFFQGSLTDTNVIQGSTTKTVPFDGSTPATATFTWNLFRTQHSRPVKSASRVPVASRFPL